MTIGTAQLKAQAAAVTEVQTLMHKHGLTLADLLAIGGRELKSPNPKTCEKARRVEKAWELMARLSVNFAHLENASPYTPTRPARRRCGEGVFLQAAENTGVSGIASSLPESNEINELVDFTPVASPEIKPGVAP